MRLSKTIVIMSPHHNWGRNQFLDIAINYLKPSSRKIEVKNPKCLCPGEKKNIYLYFTNCKEHLTKKKMEIIPVLSIEVN